MKSYVLVGIFLTATALTGCATFAPQPKPIPTAQEIRDAYYGETPKPDEYEKIVHNHYDKTLLDPYSAKYEFNGKPLKGYVTYILLASQSWVTQYGYCGTVSINARNSYGAYTGIKKFGYIIRNNAVVEMVQDMECVPLEKVQ